MKTNDSQKKIIKTILTIFLLFVTMYWLSCIQKDNKSENNEITTQSTGTTLNSSSSLYKVKSYSNSTYVAKISTGDLSERKDEAKKLTDYVNIDELVNNAISNLSEETDSYGTKEQTFQLNVNNLFKLSGFFVNKNKYTSDGKTFYSVDYKLSSVATDVNLFINDEKNKLSYLENSVLDSFSDIQSESKESAIKETLSETLNKIYFMDKIDYKTAIKINNDYYYYDSTLPDNNYTMSNKDDLKNFDVVTLDKSDYQKIKTSFDYEYLVEMNEDENLETQLIIKNPITSKYEKLEDKEGNSVIRFKNGNVEIQKDAYKYKDKYDLYLVYNSLNQK